MHLIVKTFWKDPLARASMPLEEDRETFKAVLAEQHPFLNDCWATMDGLPLYFQTAGNADIQEHIYIGWTNDHFVTSIFCICPNRTTPIAFFNIPGYVHGSQVAVFGNIYNKLEGVYLLYGAKCCVDSAFGNVSRGYLYKLCQDHLGSDPSTRELRKLDLLKKERGNFGKANSGVGNADVANILPTGER